MAGVVGQGWFVGARILRPAPVKDVRVWAMASSAGTRGQQPLHVAAKEGNATERSIPVLSLAEVASRLASNVHEQAREGFRAMYSSWVGGITTDPAAMVLPLDDHMVHRGHGVFDTALLVDGYLYELDDHLDRFLTSAAMAKIIPPFSRAEMRAILIRTTAESKCRNGVLRYWLSAGPGNFHLSPSGCVRPTFYAAVVYESDKDVDHVTVVTTSVPIKAPQFARVKSVNYLPNALAQMEAEEKGTKASIWLDEEGFIAEGPNMNVAFINSSGVLLVPSFDKILAGCTVKRMLTLATQFLSKPQAEESESLQSTGSQRLLTGIRMGNITVEEARACPEMMLVGSGVLVMPVTKWDGQAVGDGTPGAVTTLLKEMLKNDMRNGTTPQLIPIPFAS